MAPGQLSNSLLDNFSVRPSLGKGSHVHQVGAGKAFHIRKGRAQVVCQPLDHLGTPAFAALSFEYVAADLPVKLHQLAVDCLHRPLLGVMDAGFQFGQPVGVAAGWVD
ncbi:hypothetical protein D3C75_868570 [compost metagenome]